MTRPKLVVLQGGQISVVDDGWRDDGTRWCLHCTHSCVWSPTLEHWVHEENRNTTCPTDSSSSLVLAPEGTRGKRIG